VKSLREAIEMPVMERKAALYALAALEGRQIDWNTGEILNRQEP
jgi:hypothetical protein